MSKNTSKEEATESGMIRYKIGGVTETVKNAPKPKVVIGKVAIPQLSVEANGADGDGKYEGKDAATLIAETIQGALEASGATHISGSLTLYKTSE